MERLDTILDELFSFVWAPVPLLVFFVLSLLAVLATKKKWRIALPLNVLLALASVALFVPALACMWRLSFRSLAGPFLVSSLSLFALLGIKKRWRVTLRDLAMVLNGVFAFVCWRFYVKERPELLKSSLEEIVALTMPPFFVLSPLAVLAIKKRWNIILGISSCLMVLAAILFSIVFQWPEYPQWLIICLYIEIQNVYIVVTSENLGSSTKPQVQAVDKRTAVAQDIFLKEFRSRNSKEAKADDPQA